MTGCAQFPIGGMSTCCDKPASRSANAQGHDAGANPEPTV